MLDLPVYKNHFSLAYFTVYFINSYEDKFLYNILSIKDLLTN
jgi:hypothetical protein